MKKVLSLSGLIGKRAESAQLPDLGSRELGVLELLWTHKQLTAQALLRHLQADGISLSTVQSTLERLHRKNFVRREKTGRYYVYEPLITKENIISMLMHDIANNLTEGDSAPMVSGFLDYLESDAEAQKQVKKGNRES